MTQRFGITAMCCVGMIGLSLSITSLAQAPPSSPATTVATTGPAPAPAGGFGGPPTPPCGSAVTGKNMAPKSRCFELRTYTVRADSPGNIDVLHARFRDVTSRLFVKHGMTIIGYWQPVAMPDTLIYMLAYKDNATRDKQWAAFSADPEWLETRARMVVSLSVVNVFMNAADYSPIK